MSRVRTALGDLDAQRLGVTYAHEHLILDSALVEAAYPHILLNDLDAATTEVSAAVAVGVSTMVDAMPCASGRDVVRLAELSRRTGVNIIVATGLHHPRYYGPRHWTGTVSPEELAALFVADITDGIDIFDYTGPLVQRSPYRAGVIKVATGGGPLEPRDRRLFEAAAIAHYRTGAPILTHCEQGRGALEQIEAFDTLGVPANVLLLSHTDKVTDATYHREMARSGAWLLYDQGLRQADTAAPGTVALLAQHVSDGTLDRVVLGTDGARRDLWTAFGGSPGLAWLHDGFLGHMRAAGLDDAHIHALFVTNPAVALSLRVP